MKHRSTTLHSRFAVSLAACLAMAPGLTPAQQYDDPGILHSPIHSRPSDLGTQGFRLGAFLLNAGVDLVYEDHDNIYYRDEGNVSDTIYHLRPRLSLASGWSRHALAFSLVGDIARYDDAGFEDYDDLTLTMQARLDVKRDKYFTIRGSRMLLHEDRSSPDDAAGIQPTDFTNDLLGLGYHHVFNRLTAELSFDRREIDFDDNVDAQGEFIDNGDRDHTQDVLGLRLNYLIMPQRSAFVALESNTVDYDLTRDFEGYNRKSDGFRAQAGMSFDITGVLTGSVWLEYLEQDYDDPRFGTVDDTGFGMELEWSPTRLTRIALRTERAPQETTQSFTSGYIGRVYSARLQHELRRYLLLHVRVSYSDSDYSLIAGAPGDALAKAETTRAELGLSYFFNPRVHLTGGFALEDRDSNTAFEEYRAERYFLILGLDF